MRSKIIFIIGGTRSGKSAFAVSLAKKNGGQVYFIATARGSDAEMENRIRLHRKMRPAAWKTLKVSLNLPSTIQAIPAKSTVILDGLTLWISEAMRRSKNGVSRELSLLERFCNISRKKKLALIIVSDDVGGGLVPSSRLGRRFRDLAGLAHQQIAGASDNVFQMTAGIPVRIK